MDLKTSRQDLKEKLLTRKHNYLFVKPVGESVLFRACRTGDCSPGMCSGLMCVAGGKCKCTEFKFRMLLSVPEVSFLVNLHW